MYFLTVWRKAFEYNLATCSLSEDRFSLWEEHWFVYVAFWILSQGLYFGRGKEWVAFRHFLWWLGHIATICSAGSILNMLSSEQWKNNKMNRQKMSHIFWQAYIWKLLLLRQRRCSYCFFHCFSNSTICDEKTHGKDSAT